jgi:hypothetical protein
VSGARGGSVVEVPSKFCNSSLGLAPYGGRSVGEKDNRLALRRPVRAVGGVTMDPEELKWRQYALLVDLYKFYSELSLKFNLFFYAVTGAIMSI